MGPLAGPAGHRTVQVAMAVALSTLFTLHPSLQAWLHNRGAWSSMTVVLVLEQTCGATLHKALLRILGTAAGGLASVAMLHVAYCIPHQPLRALCTGLLLSTWCLGNEWLRARHAAHGYAFVVGNLTAALLVMSSYTAPGGVVAMAVDRLLAVLAGVVCVASASALVWPNYSHTESQAALERASSAVFQLGATTVCLLRADVGQRVEFLQQAYALEASIMGDLQKSASAMPLWGLEERWASAALPRSRAQQIGVHVRGLLHTLMSLVHVVEAGQLPMDTDSASLKQLHWRFSAFQDRLQGWLRAPKASNRQACGEAIAQLQAAVDSFACTESGPEGPLPAPHPIVQCTLQCTVYHWGELARVWGLLPSVAPKQD
uniref:DUF2421 domain-containing protein n=1 Tax=Eutreptiella gymnastica TaxID=73025 RepID=A0A6U8DQP9_9EUGL|mmetsp:Transcript_31785/g.57080  ORF Transcript_31785/g.57080 Transcript_31785/m.57080 type:complete len:374 (+) Transcript_31785:3-1124(+)